MEDMDHPTGQDDGSEGSGFAFGQPADPADAARTIEIRTGNELTFDPAQVTVAAGETVTFSINGRHLHRVS
jgi:plastocyanin